MCSRYNNIFDKENILTSLDSIGSVEDSLFDRPTVPLIDTTIGYAFLKLVISLIGASLSIIEISLIKYLVVSMLVGKVLYKLPFIGWGRKPDPGD